MTTGPLFHLPDSLLDALRTRRTEQQHKRAATRHGERMHQLQDEVEKEHDAFLLDPGMGPMTYITSDGRVLLDMRTWDGEPLREATDDEATAALVVGAAKTSIGDLLDLIPASPPHGVQCPMCSGTRWFTHGEVRLVCWLCRGRGWATPETITKAHAEGTWPVKEATDDGGGV